MSTFIETAVCFLIAATMQNLVLTTGMGSSAMLKIIRRPRQVVGFSGWLLMFTLASAALFYPLDMWLPDTSRTAQLLRPAIIVALAAALYIAVVLIGSRVAPSWYRRVRYWLPLAAFNSLTVGVILSFNYQVQLSFFPAMGLAVGGTVGFLALSAITAEGFSRVDNPDTPAAFRGLPVLLVYLGLLALALMGFSPVYNLV